MANAYPSFRNAIGSNSDHQGEAETLIRLLKELPADYSVFHSVHWAVPSSDRSRFGEIDFVIVNRSGHVLVIEQKNGRVEETESGLVKLYDNGSKSIQSQIDRGIEGVRKKFSQQNGGGLIIDFLVYLPDHRLVDVNSAMLDKSRIVDAVAKQSLSARVQTLLGPGAHAEQHIADQVLRFFQQQYRIVPDVCRAIELAEISYTKLSAGLLETIQCLDFKPFRLKIEGVAGSGKSLVAAHYLGSADGKKTLYVCFNSVLAEQIRGSIGAASDLVDIHTFHSLMVRAHERCAGPLAFPTHTDSAFWQNLIDAVMSFDLPSDMRFDRLIVDEGQDFQPEWWEVLRLFLVEDYELLWLEDPEQNLSGGVAVDVPATVRYRTRSSYRTPLSIAAFLSNVHGSEIVSAVAIPGMGVGVTAYGDPKEQVKLLAGKINALRARGFANEDIVVLTCGGLSASPLYGCETIAGVAVRKFLQRYDDKRQPAFSGGLISFESVRRYKGGQAPVVILTDVDPRADHELLARRVITCGLTRATVRVEMLVKADNPLNRIYLSEGDKLG